MSSHRLQKKERRTNIPMKSSFDVQSLTYRVCVMFLKYLAMLDKAEDKWKYAICHIP